MVRLATAGALLGAATFVSFPSNIARAAASADAVVQYTAGTAPTGYQAPSAALGELNPDTNAGNDFGYGALTPFNAVWQGSQMVGIGAGGTLTLHLAQTAGSIGVHTGVGLNNKSPGNGQNTDPASAYTNPRQSFVEVSTDGVVFVPIGVVDFDIPSNYFDQGITSPTFQGSPGTRAADFGKPFDGVMGDFDGKDWAGTLDVLGGSMGGEWLHVSSILPAGANFVRFGVPLGQVDPMYVDAVAVVPIPEPTSAIVLATACALVLGSRRARRNRG
jgi:hypothetical protein